jgi:hypothetical protein
MKAVIVPLLTSKDNGATEVPGTSQEGPVVFLAGPIRYWWGKDEKGRDRRESEQFKLYSNFRSYIRDRLGGEFMVYAPHLALYGPWNKIVGNEINNYALICSNAFVRIGVPDVPADGTDDEESQAKAIGIPTFSITMPNYADIPVIISQIKALTGSTL